MTETIIEINGKKYNVEVAENDLEARIGLSNVESMEDNEGMLFPFEEEAQYEFTMAETPIDLDIIFINDDGVVTKVVGCKAYEKEPVIGIAKDVLELNINSGVEDGDYVEFDVSESNAKLKPMYVLGSDGQPQAELEGGERIFSRKNTVILIRKAKKAYSLQTDGSYKSLGKFAFKYLDK